MNKPKLSAEMEKRLKKKLAEEPDWGFKADLTEEFLNQTMTINGVRFHRHRHGGGWVSEKARVDDTAWVGSFAVVHNGVVKDQAVIHDRAVIDCDGQQDGQPNVSGSAWVSGSAQVSDSAQVFGSAQVSGNGYLKKDTTKDIGLKNWETVK